MYTGKDLKWLRLCMAGAHEFSTCGKRQYMAIIVDRHGHDVGIGYNGGPKNYLHCKDGGCPRLAEGSVPGSVYDNCIAIHAEQNAILHSDYTARRDGGTLYVNGPPCFTCTKLISNSGLKRVVFVEDPSYQGFSQCEAFFDAAEVTLVPVPVGELA